MCSILDGIAVGNGGAGDGRQVCAGVSGTGNPQWPLMVWWQNRKGTAYRATGCRPFWLCGIAVVPIAPLSVLGTSAIVVGAPLHGSDRYLFCGGPSDYVPVDSYLSNTIF